MLISEALATATPRYARLDENVPASSGTIDMGMGLVAGAGIMLTLGGLLFFGIGFVWWQRSR